MSAATIAAARSPLMTPNHETARALGALGLKVFPCVEAGEGRKQPKPGVMWASMATKLPEKIDALWADRPNAAPAIKVEDTPYFIVDGDLPKIKGQAHGVDWFNALCDEHDYPIENIPTVRTPSGGRHYYFRRPPGAKIGNGRGSLPPKDQCGIDIRGIGGYVIAPGAELDTGRYELLEGPDISAAPEAPGWLLEILSSKRANDKVASPMPRVRSPIGSREEAYGQASLDDECAALARTPEGGRNNALASSAFKIGTMVGADWLTLTEARSTIVAAVAGWSDERKTLGTLDRALSAGMANPREPLQPTDLDNLTIRGEAALRSLRAAQAGADLETGEIVDDQIRPNAIDLHWAGEIAPPRRFNIKGLMTSAGCGILAGQFGAAKTFVVLDLAMKLGRGTTWFGHRIKANCGTLFVPAEGAGELPARIEAMARSEGIDPTELPISWTDSLTGPLISKGPRGFGAGTGAAMIVAKAKIANDGMKQRFGLSVGCIVVDTISAAAGFADENSAAEGAALMTVMSEISRQTGAFVLGVDHFGKSAESGVRGSSAKEAGADLILVARSEISEGGRISRTLSVRKSRWGAAGFECGFHLQPVSLGEDEDGDPISSCVIEWEAQHAQTGVIARTTERRLGTAAAAYRASLEAAIGEHGAPGHPFGAEGPMLVTVARDRIRAEFDQRYIADGDGAADARRKAFGRGEEALLARNTICLRVNPETNSAIVWFVK